MTRDRVANPLDDTTRMAPAQEAGPADAQPAAACLVVLSGSNVGEMYRIEKDQVVIGRGDKVDLRLVDDGISREHVRLSKEEGRIVLEDLGSTNGTYCNGQRVARQPLAEGDKILIGSTTILKFSYQDKLDEMFQRQMSESALRDGLTRAFNKRYFTDRIESEFQYAIRHRTPLSLIFLDIDHFKKINDQHGHQAGDHVLAQLSTLVMSMLGEEETFARYGGEEFAIVARGVELAAATELSERLRAAVEAHPFKFAATTLPVTISVGVARAPGPGMAASGDLVARADEAMYAAKRSGRNRVCSAEDGGPRKAARGGRRRAGEARRARNRQPGHRLRHLGRLSERALETRQIVGARDGDRAQALEVRRRHLSVEQRKSPLAQPRDEVADGRLRGVGAAMKHRFAAEETAQRDAVETADQRVPLPDLHAVGEPAPMQLAVRAHEVTGDPGGRAIAAGLGAGAHDILERRVDGEPPPGPPRGAPDAAVRPPGVEVEDRARIGRPPGEHRVGRPREDAGSIRGHQRLEVEPTSECHETVRRLAIAIWRAPLPRAPESASHLASDNRWRPLRSVYQRLRRFPLYALYAP